MATTKRILHLIDSAGVYGAERVILNLSSQMKNNVDFHPMVGCIVNHANEKSALYDAARSLGIDAIKVPINNARLPLDLQQVARQFKQSGINLIHSHGYKPSVFGFAIKLLTGIPVIATCHLWFEPDRGPLKMRVMVALEKRLYRWFPKVLAVSDPIRTILLKNGVKPERSTVIQNGVDVAVPALSATEKTQLRHSIGLTADDFCILNAGRLAKQKAQWALIDAAALLKSSASPCKFLIVGEGALTQELRERIAMRGVEDCVLMLGFRDDIDRLLSICDVFALPSLDEGMPMSLLEAVSAKVPAVVTAVGDIPKLIEHHKSGMIIPPENPQALADAILQYKQQPALRKSFTDAAFERLEREYSSRAMASRYIDIYHDVLGHKAQL